MSESQFHSTGLGRDFFGRHVPRIVDALERAAQAAERMVVLLGAWRSVAGARPALDAPPPAPAPALTDAGLQALVDSAARGEIDTVIVCDPQRLGRGSDRQINVLRTLTSAGLAVVCVGPVRAAGRGDAL
jgi:hypothetical protein